LAVNLDSDSSSVHYGSPGKSGRLCLTQLTRLNLITYHVYI
jgi:hypothetical protein